jgi:hypothetical protein
VGGPGNRGHPRPHDDDQVALLAELGGLAGGHAGGEHAALAQLGERLGIGPPPS